MISTVVNRQISVWGGTGPIHLQIRMKSRAGTMTDALVGIKGDAVSHALITGQSLAIGYAGSPALYTSSLVPGWAQTINDAGTLITNYIDNTVQTPGSTLVATLALGQQANTPNRHMTARAHGASGKEYVALRKGTSYYTDALARVSQGVTAAVAQYAMEFRVRSLHIIHGEADMREGTSRAQYLAYLERWWADYNADVKAITGQDDDLVVILCQVNSWPTYVPTTGPSTGLAQLDFARNNPDKVFMVGPKYALETNADNVHLTNLGYYRLGELHGRVAKRVLLEQGPWLAFAPKTITQSGATITITFNVPAPPLVFDTTTVTAQANMGFAYYDDTSSASISSVAITGAKTVQITLNTTPTGTNPTIGYGTTTRLGNLRDSDTGVSLRDGAALRNWCCHFRDPVPYQ